MCGRYVSPERAAIERAWHIGRSNGNPFNQRYNVAPTTVVPILRAGPEGEIELLEARWGLVPSWWKDEKPPQSTFNARSEEAPIKPMWRQPYRQSRCLVPAVGWYEWKAAETVVKATGQIRRFRQPYFIYPADRRLICFAGLMSIRVVGERVEQRSCAILTRAAQGRAAEIHDRMPVVLPEGSFESWLSPNVNSHGDVAAMVGSALGDFELFPVSTRLNAARDDDPGLMRPVQ